MASARIILPRCASCSPCQRLRPSAKMLARPMRLPPLRRSTSVPAAAAACTLSRPSREAAGGGSQRRFPLGATPHEHKRFQTDCCPSSPPLTCRPRPCSPKRIATDAIRAPASLHPAAPAPLSRYCSWRRTSPRSPAHLSGLAASRSHADGGVKILIALCSSWCPASRGFLP